MVGVIQTFYKYIESDSIEISFMCFLGTLGSSYFPFSLLLGKKLKIISDLIFSLTPGSLQTYMASVKKIRVFFSNAKNLDKIIWFPGYIITLLTKRSIILKNSQESTSAEVFF